MGERWRISEIEQEHQAHQLAGRHGVGGLNTNGHRCNDDEDKKRAGVYIPRPF